MPGPFTAFQPLAASHAGSHDRLSTAGKGPSWWAMTLIVMLLFATTTAAAVMATSGSHAPIPALWKQEPPSLFNKGPEGTEYRELLF